MSMSKRMVGLYLISCLYERGGEALASQNAERVDFLVVYCMILV